MGRVKGVHTADVDYTELLLLLSEGTPLYQGCKKLNLNRATFYNRLKEDKELEQEYKKAQFLFDEYMKDLSIEKIIKGVAGVWQSGGWWLERKHPEQFGTRKEPEIKEKQDYIINYIQR